MCTRLLSPIDYDKLSDDLYYLGNGIILRFNVILAKKREDGTRNYFHHEYMYDSKYTDNDKVITMRRNFDYYLTIEKPSDFAQSIQIRLHHMIALRAKLREVSKWFTDSKTFIINRGKLTIQGKPPQITITGFSSGKCLSFDPIIIDDKVSGMQQPGVRLVMNNSDLFTDIPIDYFYGLFYLIDSFNMYQSAQLLVNYLGRPNYGDNLVEFEKPDYQMDEYTKKEIPPVTAKDGRMPKNNNSNVSFFDKIDEM